MLKQGSWTSGDEAAQAGFDLRLFYKVLPDLIFEPLLDVCCAACQALLHSSACPVWDACKLQGHHTSPDSWQTVPGRHCGISPQVVSTGISNVTSKHQYRSAQAPAS